MKFMKLGSKPDSFRADGELIRYAALDLAIDVTIVIEEVKFYLHKFPLLSKSGLMRKQVSKANEDNSGEIVMIDFPGGPKAFEICAKFCYGITVTLNAYNVVAAYCAAKHLEMTENVDRGNLIYKIDVFLNSSIFRSWKDSIIVLQTTASLLPCSEDLKIMDQCVDSIASKTCVDPESVSWSYTYNRRLDGIVEERDKPENVPEDWWIEDVCELGIDLFKQVLVAVKSKGRMDDLIIGEALRNYLVRWLPGSVEALTSEPCIDKNKLLMETIVGLLPNQKGVVFSCGFLLKLLKVSILVGVDDSKKEDLVRRVSLNLQEASVDDLLNLDVDLVHQMVGWYVMGEKCGQDEDEKGVIREFVLGHGSMLNAAKLIDGYLAEIAHGPDLPVSSFIDLSRLIPDSARLKHDGLYKAIDTYLKEHPGLTKAEKKKICSLMDPAKLTTEASMHAAQNERLPLRITVQVLYFAQLKANEAASYPCNSTNLQSTTSQPTNQSRKIKDEEEEKEWTKKFVSSKSSRSSGARLMPSRSRRIFEKLWPVIGGKGQRNKSSEISSGSSKSSTASLAPVDAKSLGLSSRRRRHSIS